MAEKRRGLGRGLGALIPSAPPEESEVSSESLKQSGRPADLFFTSGQGHDGTPGAKRAQRGTGINKDALIAPSRRNGGKPAAKTAPPTKRGAVPPAADAAEVTAVSTPAEVSRETDSAPVPGDVSTAPSSTTRGTGAKGRTKASSASEGAVAADAPADARPQPDQAPEPADARGAADTAVDVREAGNDPQKGGAAFQNPVGTSQSPAEAQAVVVEPAEEEGREAPVQAEVPTADVTSDTAAAVEAAKPADSAGVAGDDLGGLLEVPGARFAELPLDAIHPNRKQPRSVFDADEMAELVHSIREIGVLQPIVVRPSSEKGDAPYELVMGERRWRATREAGLERVPAIIRSTTDDDLLRDALLENLHRSSLNPLEEAAAYQQLLDDFGCSHEELAERIGRSRPQISNTLRLMKLPPLVQRRVAAGVLSAGHARALLGLADQADMEKLAQRIVAEGLSVRSTEEIVAMSDGLRRQAKPATPRNAARHERLDYLATSLSDRLDTSVKITLGARKGKVSIEFASVDDLNRIMTVLAPPSN